MSTLIYDSALYYNNEKPALPANERIRIEYRPNMAFSHIVHYWQGNNYVSHCLQNGFDFSHEASHVKELRQTGLGYFVLLSNAIEFAINYLTEE